MFAFGKESDHLDMHQHHHQARRTLSASHVYPSQVLYDTSYNPLYNHAYARSSAYNSQYAFNENKSPDAFNPTLFGTPGHFKQSNSMSGLPQSQGLMMGSGSNGAESSDAHFGM